MLTKHAQQGNSATKVRKMPDNGGGAPCVLFHVQVPQNQNGFFPGLAQSFTKDVLVNDSFTHHQDVEIFQFIHHDLYFIKTLTFKHLFNEGLL